MRHEIITVVLSVSIFASFAFADENRIVNIERGSQKYEYKINNCGVITSFSLTSHLSGKETEGVDEGIYQKAAVNGKSGKIAVVGINRHLGKDHLILLLVSPDGHNVKKIVFNLRVTAATIPDWVSENIIVLRPNHIGYQKHRIINTVDHSIKHVDEGTFLAVDPKAQNYALIYGDLNWFVPEHGPYSGGAGFARSQSNESVFLRYNGYWVYPKPLKAWLNKEEYEKEKWDNKIGWKGSILGSMGARIGDTTYDLSVPAFVGDTAWVAFIERVYKSGNPTPAEHSLVLLDAHKVNTNPPEQKDISIKKKSIAPIPVEEISRDVMLKWNEETNEVEIWKGDRRNLISETLLGHIPINTSTMEAGEYQQGK